MATPLACSFCHRAEHQVAKLVSSPSGVMICDACVAIAARIMHESPPRASLWRRLAARVRAAIDGLRQRSIAAPA
jgi:ATP-dependent protease Clp ATPase subunit